MGCRVLRDATAWVKKAKPGIIPCARNMRAAFRFLPAHGSTATVLLGNCANSFVNSGPEKFNEPWPGMSQYGTPEGLKNKTWRDWCGRVVSHEGCRCPRVQGGNSWAGGARDWRPALAWSARVGQGGKPAGTIGGPGLEVRMEGPWARSHLVYITHVIGHSDIGRPGAFRPASARLRVRSVPGPLRG